MKRLASAAAALVLSTALAAPAAALTHREQIYQACLRDGRSASACACTANRYAAELTDRELAFYARMIGRENDQRAMMAVMREVGLSLGEVGALARKLQRIEAEVNASCGR